MHDSEPARPSPDGDESAVERRFAELLDRFWRHAATEDAEGPSRDDRAE